MNFKSLGSYVLLIKNKPYEVMLPEVDGVVNYAVDTDLEMKERWYTVNGKKIPELNILWFVKGMTPEISSNLDTKEQILILKDYYSGLKAVKAIIKDHGDNMEEGKKDYDSAVNNILSGDPDFSSSRMASIRLAEKIIKLKLQSEGAEFKGYKRFADCAEKLDCGDIDGAKQIISQIEHSLKEVDSDIPATCEEAVNLLKISLQLYLKLFHPLKNPEIKMRDSSQFS